MIDALHLHPIAETHQFNPSLTYLDEISKAQKRQSRRGVATSDDEDDPPPDIDDPAPATGKQFFLHIKFSVPPLS